MYKKILNFALVLVLVISVSVQQSSAASMDSKITPRWNNVSNVDITLVNVGNALYLSVSILGEESSTLNGISIGLFKMTKPNQGTVAQWTNMYSNTRSFSFSQTVDAEPSGGYRVIVRFNAVKNGVSEAVNAHLDKTF